MIVATPNRSGCGDVDHNEFSGLRIGRRVGCGRRCAGDSGATTCGDSGISGSAGVPLVLEGRCRRASPLTRVGCDDPADFVHTRQARLNCVYRSHLYHQAEWRCFGRGPENVRGRNPTEYVLSGRSCRDHVRLSAGASLKRAVTRHGCWHGGGSGVTDVPVVGRGVDRESLRCGRSHG